MEWPREQDRCDAKFVLPPGFLAVEKLLHAGNLRHGGAAVHVGTSSYVEMESLFQDLMKLCTQPNLLTKGI